MGKLAKRPEPEIIDAEFTVIGEPEPPCYEQGSWPPRDAGWNDVWPFWLFLFSVFLAIARHVHGE